MKEIFLEQNRLLNFKNSCIKCGVVIKTPEQDPEEHGFDPYTENLINHYYSAAQEEELLS
jgi:hypothetical protein